MVFAPKLLVSAVLRYHGTLAARPRLFGKAILRWSITVAPGSTSVLAAICLMLRMTRAPITAINLGGIEDATQN
ncbi:hypothetical protein FB451DRAFT_1267916 [Mycena latifolia]|nr:hypothetical protein FB451DRAFT_1267916 [Mycena latifolia]